MGLYDTVEFHVGISTTTLEKRFAQLKCWNGGENFKSYKIGDIVPEIEIGIHTYLIALREGGFLQIENDRIMGWQEKVQIPIIFDKWGMRFDPETETTDNGLLPGERYKF